MGLKLQRYKGYNYCILPYQGIWSKKAQDLDILTMTK